MLIFECCVTITCKCSLSILRMKNTAWGYIKVAGFDTAIFIKKKSQDGLRKKVRTKESKLCTYMYKYTCM